MDFSVSDSRVRQISHLQNGSHTHTQRKSMAFFLLRTVVRILFSADAIVVVVGGSAAAGAVAIEVTE